MLYQVPELTFSFRPKNTDANITITMVFIFDWLLFGVQSTEGGTLLYARLSPLKSGLPSI